MILKEKSWVWKLTWPFAHDNCTEVPTGWGDFLFHPKGKPPLGLLVRHEEIHFEQAHRVGWFLYLFLYYFALPVLWNPWRKKWEFQAYTEGSRMSEERTRALLRSYKYGWLIL